MPSFRSCFVMFLRCSPPFFCYFAVVSVPSHFLDACLNQSLSLLQDEYPMLSALITYLRQFDPISGPPPVAASRAAPGGSTPVDVGPSFTPDMFVDVLHRFSPQTAQRGLRRARYELPLPGHTRSVQSDRSRSNFAYLHQVSLGACGIVVRDCYFSSRPVTSFSRFSSVTSLVSVLAWLY